MRLSDFESECDKYQKIIVSQDPGSKPKHIAENIDSSEVYQYRVDGYLIQDGKRCDFLLLNKSKASIYYIELKGSNLETAVEQIETSELELNRKFQQDLDIYVKAYYRVVLNKVCTHQLDSNKVKRFKQAHLNRYVFKTKEYREMI